MGLLEEQRKQTVRERMRQQGVLDQFAIEQQVVAERPSVDQVNVEHYIEFHRVAFGTDRIFSATYIISPA